MSIGREPGPADLRGHANAVRTARRLAEQLTAMRERLARLVERYGEDDGRVKAQRAKLARFQEQHPEKATR